jgi:hypothetical protein
VAFEELIPIASNVDNLQQFQACIKTQILAWKLMVGLLDTTDCGFTEAEEY